MAHEVLIVDDESDIRMLIAEVLHDEGYVTRSAAHSEGALEELSIRRPNLVILDIWLDNSRLDGIELLHAINHEHPSVPVVMISGHGTIETAVTAIKVGAYDFIEKPFKAEHLLLVTDRAIEAARIRQENEELRLRAGPQSELVGESAVMNQLRQVIAKVAPTQSRVLITGPPGAGKEGVARTLHQKSKRGEGPFVVVN